MAMVIASDIATPVQAEPEELVQDHSEDEQANEDDVNEPASPLGSALLRIRRTRAFLGKEKALALAEQLEAELQEPGVSTAKAMSSASSDETHSGGLTQEALDALCVDEESSDDADEAEEDETPVLRQPAAKVAAGLDQAALDALCVENRSSDSEEEEQLSTERKPAESASPSQASMPSERPAGALAAESLRAEAFAWCCCPCVEKADTVKIKPVNDKKKVGKYKGEALLLQVRRLRAFRGEAEAAEFAAKMCAETEPQVQKSTGPRSKPRPTQLETPIVSSPEVSPRKDTSPCKDSSSRMGSPVLRVATPQRKRLASKNPSSPCSPSQPAGSSPEPRT